MHDKPHEFAGKKVEIISGPFEGQTYLVEDWWDRVAGKSWMDCVENLACLEYAVRSASEGFGFSNEVVYGKFGGLGKLIHISQLATEPAQ
jgi:hypothetical protein